VFAPRRRSHSYERTAIVAWLKRSDKSPKTNLVLEDKTVRPNHTLRSTIEEWQEEHAAPPPAPPPAPPQPGGRGGGRGGRFGRSSARGRGRAMLREALRSLEGRYTS
jgi:hypothetical protein